LKRREKLPKWDFLLFTVKVELDYRDSKPQSFFRLWQLDVFPRLRTFPFTICALGLSISSEVNNRKINIYLASSKWMISQATASLNQTVDLILKP
jgi:hypothetical protein